MLRLAALVLALLVPLWSSAQGFPAKPIRVLVGFSAGGAPDIIARMLARSCRKASASPS